MHSRPFLLITLIAALAATTAAFAQDDSLQQARARLAEWEGAATKAQGAQTQEEAQALLREAQTALDDSLSLFAKGGVMQSADVEALNDYARALAVSGDFDLAAGVFRRLTEVAPDVIAHWTLLARALVEMGGAHLAEARTALDRALELAVEPEEAAEVHSRAGALYLREKLWPLAQLEYQAALEKAPGFPPALLGMAVLDIREGRMEAASAVVDQASAQPMLAAEFLDRHLPPALDAFERSRRTFPDTAGEHAGYGKLLLRVGNAPLAVLAFQRATQLEPGNHVLWNFLASAHKINGHDDDARGAYQKSLEINPDQPRTRQELQSLPAPTFGS
jgi:Flp pilus assembly protein TadD